MTAQKAAWGRIRDDYAAMLSKEEGGDYVHDSRSINDAVNREYREGRITEAERDAMREHVKEWLGDPAKSSWNSWMEPGYDPNWDGYAKFACGLWAPTAAPWGETELGLVLMAVTIMEEEAA